VFLELYASKLQIANSKRELERTYHELQATQAQLVQSAKMASLGELVAGVAHEINNPLAFAIGHLETVQRGLGRIEELEHPEASPQAKPHWEKVKSRLGETDMGLKRIRELVVKLRTFSRIDGGERGVANLNECVESVLTILGHKLKDGIEVVKDLVEPESLECYPGLLNQALMNLIANAVDAIEGHGTITVASRTAATNLVLTVTDSGPGIPLAIRQRIFEPFFTTKPVGAGTGLGLSITYSIAQKHGGTLGVECPPEGGTCMKLTLPLQGPPAEPTD
jgi:two-component system NtrC family sensor kinase